MQLFQTLVHALLLPKCAMAGSTLCRVPLGAIERVDVLKCGMLNDDLVSVQDIKDADLVCGIDRELLHIASGELQHVIGLLDDQQRLAAMVNANLEQGGWL